MANVPASVAYINRLGIGPEVVRRRLIDDARMHSVWRVLRQQRNIDLLVAEEYALVPSQDWQGLLPEPQEESDFVDRDLKLLCEVACGVFFAYASVIMGGQSVACLESNWQAEEQLWSWMLSTIRSELQWKRGKDAQTLEDAANILSARFCVYRKSMEAHVFGGSTRKVTLDVRDKLIVLARKTNSLYGRCLTGTLATVTNVALAQQISATDAENWIRLARPVIKDRAA